MKKPESELAKAIREMKERDQNCFGDELFKESEVSAGSRGEVIGKTSSKGDYSYTEKHGSVSVTLTFKTNVELLAFYHSQKEH